MQARRAVAQAGEPATERAAREAVDQAKRRLGERGSVWWDDDAPDETCRAPWTTRYADWWNGLPEDQREAALRKRGGRPHGGPER